MKEDCAQGKYKAYELFKNLSRVCHCNSFLQTQKILKELVGINKGNSLDIRAFAVINELCCPTGNSSVCALSESCLVLWIVMYLISRHGLGFY